MDTYTKLPNHIVDAMPDMSKAELKVTIAIVRHTYGFHNESCELTFTELQELTGMSRGGVAAGVKSVVERGFFTHNGSNWAVYQVDQSGLNSRPKKSSDCTESVYSVDQSGLITRPETVYSVDQNEPVLKKEKENNKETNDDGDDFTFADAVSAYENNIAVISPTVSDDIGLAVDEVGAKWVIDAVKIAARKNVKNWSYISAILKNWQALGYQDIKKPGNGRMAQPAHNGTANNDGSFY